MLTFDTSITVYNAVFNDATNYDDYFRTVIHNCSWNSKIKAVATATGLVYDRLFKVRLLDGFSITNKQYAAPEAYASPATQYTLPPGTIILKGDGPPTPTDGKGLAALLADHDEAFKVLDYHDNRRVGLHHIYVEGR